MKAHVPASALPTQMAADNRLTTIYSTHVLIPKLGPLATQRYTRLYARLLKDLAVAVELVLAAKAYARTHHKQVAIPAPPPPANQRDFRFKPPLRGGNAYLRHYVAGLAPFGPARLRVDHGTVKAAVTQTVQPRSAPAKKTPARATASTPPLPNAPGDAGKAPFQAAGVWPTEVRQLLRDDPQLEVTIDGRLLIDPIGPRHLLADRATRKRGHEWAKPGKHPVDDKTVGHEVAGGAAGFDLAQILHGIAQPNAVLEDLLSVGALNASGVWLGEVLTNTGDVPQAIADILVKLADRLSKTRPGLEPLIAQAVALLLELGVTDITLLERLRKASLLRDALFGYLAWRVDRLHGIDAGPAPLPDDSVIVGSREWAFSRTERLAIGVGTPTLRGPFAAEAVAPASKLVTSESSLQEVVTFREQGSARSRSRSSESGSFNAATFRQALSHMAEEGINSEAAFSQDTTLFDSLRERRREAIDRTLTQISASNEQRSGTVARSVTSQSRSYTTRGKDPLYATTEVAFQVAAPVDVEVRLEDVGLVWCPRIPSPFIALHRLVVNEEREARADYIAQNQVIDPVRPPESSETASFGSEVSVRGNTRTQVVSFDIEIPGQYLDWELDPAACKVDFRNGTSADYNWDEFWNLDDLENWHVYYRSITRVGFRVQGTAVFETTDPEMLNRGFLVFDIVVQRLTDESRVAIAAYEADRQEAAAQRQAVEVRANQYARLRRDELIEQYEGSLELQDEAFSQLVRRVFQGGNRDHVSYWREILRSCIDWSAAGMRFEPADMMSMAYPQLPPTHFMNAQGIRFILPVQRSAETAFFDALQTGAGSYFQRAATQVRAFVTAYREIVEKAKVTEPDKLVLDHYTSEIVLGRHLEAVLSEHPFAEAP